MLSRLSEHVIISSHNSNLHNLIKDPLLQSNTMTSHLNFTEILNSFTFSVIACHIVNSLKS